MQSLVAFNPWEIGILLQDLMQAADGIKCFISVSFQNLAPDYSFCEAVDENFLTMKNYGIKK